MECHIIQGIREGSQLLHVLPEDMLYVKKCVRNGETEWICYQTRLSAPKKNKDRHEKNCTARIKQCLDGTFKRMNVSHTKHNDHGYIRNDMRKRNNMKAACKTLKYQHQEEAHKISVKHIFHREISK